MSKRDTLFYDGKCPLCIREVRLLSQVADDDLQLVDLHEVPEIPGEPTRLERLNALHLRASCWNEVRYCSKRCRTDRSPRA